MVNADGHDVELASWDWSYYAEQVRADRYDFDASELRPFFEMDNVLEKYSMQRRWGDTILPPPGVSPGKTICRGI